MPYVIDCIVYIILFLQAFGLVLSQLKADEDVVAINQDGALYQHTVGGKQLELLFFAHGRNFIL